MISSAREISISVAMSLIALTVATPLYAEQPSTSPSKANFHFQVKPDRCIALRQGQVCYQKLTFQWAAINREVCLVEKGKSVTIKCWTSNSATRFKYAFESDSEKTYQLQDKTSQATLAEVKVNVAWVYKNSEKVSTGWRLF